ncbi:hypothetical protein CW704_04515 [Candidatus Bathyarchaeota archaeon]|nr:MAG: hypothetical protein CW704_04515 [Candidatus Bathyarchaeota archaeon]
MKKNELPPGQHEIPALLRWNIDHPGITDENPDTGRNVATATLQMSGRTIDSHCPEKRIRNSNSS